jgi:hypothetical protein
LSNCPDGREVRAPVAKARSEDRCVAALATSPPANAMPTSTTFLLCALANTWPCANEIARATCSRSRCRYALDLDTEACVTSDGGLEEGYGSSLLLVGHDVGECDAGMIVDTTDATAVAPAAAVAGDAI